MKHWYTILLILLGYSSLVCPFPAENIPYEEDTISHRIITTRAFYKAMLKFLKRPEVVAFHEDYFDPGDSTLRVKFRINSFEIAKFGGNMQRNHGNEAKYHVDGEQIKEAHNYIRGERNRIIQALTTNFDLAYARQVLGQCLYVIQSFYSNTNWVEMYGGTSYYKNFGQNSATAFMEIAGASEDTCSNCPNDKTSIENGACKNNIIITSKLTSGYKSGQDVAKPNKALGSPNGKCSHGGSMDASRDFPATGGIYKGRSKAKHAPHYHLHEQAYEAAKLAVEGFLIDDDIGLVIDIGIQKFQDLMEMKPRNFEKTLALVIDVTGSMMDNIQQVKDGLERSLTLVIGTDIEPVLYILVTFSDPVDLETQWNTTDGYEMIAKIKSLTVFGGGDCPEYSLTGAKTAVELSRTNSKVVVFTDAHAKDEDMRNAMTSLAVEKNVVIDIVELGGCVKRRRKRSASSVYANVTASTGGTLYKTTTAGVSYVTQEIIKSTLATSIVNLKHTVYDSSASDQIPIEVDNKVTGLNIDVTGPSSVSVIALRKSDGSEISLSSENVTVLTSIGKIILIIQQPEFGLWKLLRNEHVQWGVNITASSDLDFDVRLLETSNDGLLYQLQNNPIYGENYTISMDVFNLQNGSVDFLILTDSNGHDIAILNVTNTNTEDDVSSYKTSLQFTTVVNGFKLQGTDEIGNTFFRSKYTEVKPVNVELKIQPFTRDMWVGSEENITYEITNAGAATGHYTVYILNDKGHVLTTTRHYHTLNPGNSSSHAFTIEGLKSEIVTYTIEVRSSSTSELLQSQSMKLMVFEIQRPSCTVVNTLRKCPLESLQAGKCSLYKWSASTNIEYSGISLYNVSLLNASSPSVQLSYTNISLRQGPIMATLSGDCCSATVFLNTSDDLGDFTMSSCQFEIMISDTVKADDTNNPTEDSSSTMITVIAVISAVVGVAVVVVSILMIKSHFTPKNVADSNMLFPEVEKSDTMKRSFNPKNLFPKGK